MANALYNLYRDAVIERATNYSAWNTGGTGSGSIRMGVVKTSSGYTVNLSTDQYVSVTGFLTNEWGDNGDQTYNGSTQVTSPTSSLGVADAADVTMVSVSNGSVACGAAVLWQQQGSAATSPFILYLDTATGLPITPNGANITVTWDNGANKIFAI